jgi:hypothetical protein
MIRQGSRNAMVQEKRSQPAGGVGKLKTLVTPPLKRTWTIGLSTLLNRSLAVPKRRDVFLYQSG